MQFKKLTVVGQQESLALGNCLPCRDGWVQAIGTAVSRSLEYALRVAGRIPGRTRLIVMAIRSGVGG